jgi:hypothetical protein
MRVCACLGMRMCALACIRMHVPLSNVIYSYVTLYQFLTTEDHSVFAPSIMTALSASRVEATLLP